MEKKLQDLIEEWPQFFIQDSDLALRKKKSDDARYSAVKWALKKGVLIRVRRGLYLIADKIKRSLLDEFELALLIYGPSFVSLESALSYHGWIPESVYTTTCVSTKRAKAFETPIGVFRYKRVPEDQFYVLFSLPLLGGRLQILCIRDANHGKTLLSLSRIFELIKKCLLIAIKECLCC